jgi:hypothetical protein
MILAREHVSGHSGAHHAFWWGSACVLVTCGFWRGLVCVSDSASDWQFLAMGREHWHALAKYITMLCASLSVTVGHSVCNAGWWGERAFCDWTGPAGHIVAGDSWADVFWIMQLRCVPIAV